MQIHVLSGFWFPNWQLLPDCLPAEETSASSNLIRLFPLQEAMNVMDTVFGMQLFSAVLSETDTVCFWVHSNYKSLHL